VVSGGPGEEREVSLESGESVARALEGEGLPVRRLVIAESLDPFLDEIRAENGVAFLALHGRYGEDGGAQRALEAAGVAYTGSGPEASRLAMHKPAAKRIFQARGIRTPKYEIAERHAAGSLSPEGAEGVLSRLSSGGVAPPVVVKPAASGSSVGVTIVRDAGALGPALEKAWAYGPEALVEEYVEGRELSVAVLEGRALPVCELAPAREFYDYEAKYSDDRTQIACPAELDPGTRSRVRDEALAAFGALGARDFGRVDLRLAKDGTPCVLEVNTIPGFTAHSLVPRAAREAGIAFGELCLRIVYAALRRGGKGKKRWSEGAPPAAPP
jgi:D-alanine-D-alanine ligase